MSKIAYVSRPCKECAGTGRIAVVDPASLRRLRDDAKISLRALAAKMGVTAAYLSDMEHGRRGVSPRMLEAYLKAFHERAKG